MAQTFALVEAHLPRDLSAIVRTYFESRRRDPLFIAQAGEYEACFLLKQNDACFRGACFGGQLSIVELMIDRGSNDWNDGLDWACYGGHLTTVELMIARGANNWNTGFARACRGGHLAIIEMMIARGANNWNWGLFSACLGGHLEIVELMIARGADGWNTGLARACRGGNRAIVKLMISRGATSCSNCKLDVQSHDVAGVRSSD